MIIQLVQRSTSSVDRRVSVVPSSDGVLAVERPASDVRDLKGRLPLDLGPALAAGLARVPRDLAPSRGADFPLLAALHRGGAHGVARALMLIGALVHNDADERRVAEYFLRHRDDVRSGLRSPEKLISAAATAAYLDARRTAMIEMPAGSREDVVAPGVTGRAQDTPAVGEVLVSYLRRAVVPRSLSPRVSALLLDAVPIALALAERHALNGGTGPSIVAMRSDTRPSARLATHLRGITGDHPMARSLARVLVGPEAAPLETALLWWVAQGESSHERRPMSITDRWVRDLKRIESRYRDLNSVVPAA